MAFLIAKYLPNYTYHEYHKRIVSASAKECFLATRSLNMKRSVVIKMLLKIRGLPTTDLCFDGFLKNMCFKYVEEDLYKEFIIDASRGNLQIFWNFYFKEVGENRTIVSTETRILCLTKKIKFRFSLYWFFVKPFSGITRKEMLRLIKKKAEKSHPV
jgi:hypothetical protein